MPPLVSASTALVQKINRVIRSQVQVQVQVT